MQKLKNTSKRLLSMLLAAVMLLGTTSTALASEVADEYAIQPLHVEGEESEGDHDETPYAISIYNEKAPNKNGSLTYTVTSHEDGSVSDLYGLEDTNVTAVEGDTITLYPVANEGYVLSSIGYAKTERIEQAFNIKEVTDNKDGSYSFTMPAYPIHVGAAFYAENDYYVLKEAGTSNLVANVDPLHVIELGLNHAWLHENAEEVSVDMHLDTRILEFGEDKEKELTFRMEIREVGNSGFVLKGSKEYTREELKTLVEAKKYGDSVVDEKGRTYYYLKNVTIPVDADKDFTYAEDGEFEVYCTAMYTLDGWTNAIGAPYYRWGYSGGDRAYILKNETSIPASMVYFYNLDPETYHGALAAEAVAKVEEEMGIDIDVRYFTAENMTERIGYLAEWPGYESYGELGVDRQPSEKTYKKKIVLYCSLPSMVRDKLGDYIRETGVTNLLSSKLTAYGAAKSFEEFYKTQETEASVFTAALSLSLLTYETSTVVTEEKYGDHELWSEFKEAYDECRSIINTTAEQEESVYTNARLKLLDVYLRIIDKVQLTTEFKFVIEEHDDNNYKITVDRSNFPEDLEVTYRWYDASKEDHKIIPKNELYKIRCSISAAEDGPYYGFKEISLAPPAEMEYEVSGNTNSVSVDFTKYETLTNTPEPITYTAELYQGEELKQTLSNETAETLTFTGLESSTQYTVRLYASNIVGRTTYLSQQITTCGVTVRNDIENGTVAIEPVDYAIGDTIIITATPDEGYTLAQVGYWTVDENGKESKIVNAIDNKNGTYSFTMPASNVVVGASFIKSDGLQLFPNSGSGTIYANGDSLSASIKFGASSLRANEEGTWARVNLDKTFFDEKYADDGVTFTIQLCQHDNVAYYKVAGQQTYKSFEELKEAATNVVDNGSYYTFDLPIEAAQEEGQMMDSEKCYPLDEDWIAYVDMFIGKTGWVDAKGEPAYAERGTSLDVRITAEDAKALKGTVLLYNMDASTYNGHVLREYLAGEGIKVVDITNENFNQRIGYLVGWEGDAYAPLPDDEAYDPNTYDFTYLLKANLSEVQADAIIFALDEESLDIDYQSSLTVYTAGMTFKALTQYIQEEDEAFKARIALGILLVEVQEAVLENEDFKNNEGFEAMRAAWVAGHTVYMSTDEKEVEEYQAAYDAVLEQYLSITEKKMLAGEVELVLEKQADGTYNVEVKINSEDSFEEGELVYQWQDKSAASSLTGVAATDLYKVRVKVSGSNKYYGSLSGNLSVPADPTVNVTAGKSSVSVTFEKLDDTVNVPAPIYTAELYKNGDLVETKEKAKAGTLTFTGLSSSTDYEVKAYAYNAVGHSAIQTIEVTTTSGGGSSSGSSSSVKPPVEPVVPEEKPNTTFVDVSDDQYYADAVAWAVEEGITSGTSATTFSPYAVCTRAQTVTFLWKAAGSPKPKSVDSPFDDVKKGDYYYDAVLWAAENGITGGTSATTFSPDATVTRSQNVTFLWRMAGSPAAEQMNSFTDVTADTYYHDAVIWAAEEGITSGTSATTFGPENPCLRSQIVTFLYRYMVE